MRRRSPSISMSYKVLFLPTARKEWDKLDNSVREQFRRKLRERLASPRNVAARLSGMPDCYKIKLRPIGYRLVYRVDDGRVIVTVIAVGRRDGDAVYTAAARRLQ